ncbi:MAG: DmsE family decaheme c-type cytochrome [Elusimicrobia bacterium]|nr:DmsE family decaheme c-type cytochrome [Elusimicrobiota bacterium]
MKLKNFDCIVAALAALVVCAGAASAQQAATYVGSDTCVACHSEQAAAYNKSLHGKTIPLVKKIAADKACETCHGAGSLHAAAAGDKTNPGFATIKNPAKQKGSDASAVCFTCHNQKKVMLWDTGTHAAKGLTCNTCHSVHNGNGSKNLKKDVNALCYDCHKGKKAEMSLPSHHPLQEGKMTCTGCHNPHGGALGNLNGETVNETCYKCHSDKAGPYAHEHAPVAENCGNCHKPHGSANQNLLKQAQPYLCLRCHKSEHSVPVMPSSRSGFSNKVLDLVKRNCYDCHKDIHGSDSSAGFGH